MECCGGGNWQDNFYNTIEFKKTENKTYFCKNCILIEKIKLLTFKEN